MHLVIHPLFDVVRDITGALQEVRPVADGDDRATTAPTSCRESWMHVEIDRIPDGEDVAEIEESIQRVLRDVREAVEDWDKMHAQVAEIVARARRPTRRRRRRRRGRARRATCCSGSPTTTSRSSATASTTSSSEGDDEYLRGVPGTGLGILRADQDMSQHVRPAARRRPPPRPARRPLLVLTKANSRSTVHRPAYLDYVGVKKFENGEVVGERRFLGLFSSAAYTESLTRIPLLRERADGGAEADRVRAA